jgi:hypothetical protein
LPIPETGRRIKIRRARESDKSIANKYRNDDEREKQKERHPMMPDKTEHFCAAYFKAPDLFAQHDSLPGGSASDIAYRALFAIPL